MTQQTHPVTARPLNWDFLPFTLVFAFAFAGGALGAYGVRLHREPAPVLLLKCHACQTPGVTLTTIDSRKVGLDGLYRYHCAKCGVFEPQTR